MLFITTEKIPIKVWLDDEADFEEGARLQARNLAMLPFAFRHIAIMPDVHEGYGMPIGGVLATRGVVVPNAVGVDIGCGMIAMRTSLPALDQAALKAILGEIRKVVPVGFAHHKEPREWDGFASAPEIPIIQQELNSARCQLGTLGGGNHFIEIQRDDAAGEIWVMIHSGSRNFGYKTAKVYHEKAKALCARWHSALPTPDLAFLPLDSYEGNEYLNAMNFCLAFAKANREAMMQQVLKVLLTLHGPLSYTHFDVHHNYAAMEHHFGADVMIHRKGAIRMRVSDVGIIPGSMGTASYIVAGLGNEESFCSASHGAGRRMGRKEATRTLYLATEQEKMGDIVHGLRCAADLEEAPGAYKDIDVVIARESDLVTVVRKLRPLAAMKG